MRSAPLAAPAALNALLRYGWLLAALAAALLYLPTLGYDFTYDDVPLITANPRIRNLSAPARYLTTNWWDDKNRSREYRPATMASFALNYAVCQLHPRGYHAVNIVLHALNGTLLWLLTMRLFRNRTLALVAALLFVLHPAHVEAVAGIVGRAELLVTAAFLLTMLAAYASYAAPTPSGRGLWAGAALLTGLLAVFSKEHGVLILPAVLLLGLLPFKGLADADAAWPTAAERRRRLARLAPALAAAALAVALFFVARLCFLGSILPASAAINMLDNPLTALHGLPRFMTAVAVIGRYGLLLVLPFWAAPDYSYQAILPVRDPADPLWLPGLILILAAVAAIYLLRRRPVARFGLLFMLLTFQVGSNLLFTIGTIMADRLLYLPSLGFCLLVPALALGEAPLRRGRRTWITLAALGFWAILLLGQHCRYLPVWRDNGTLFPAMIERMPRSSRGHGAYATYLMEQKKYQEALTQINQANEIYPNHVETITSLGLIHLQLGRERDALIDFEKANLLDPSQPLVIFYFARLLTQSGRPERAASVIAEGLRKTQGRDPLIGATWGIWLTAQRRWKEATPWLEGTLGALGDEELWTGATLALAHCYIGQGQSAKARARIEAVLKTDPRNADALALRRQGVGKK